MTLLLLSLVLVTLFAVGQAWGPGTHLEYAERVLRRRRELLPPRVANLLTKHRSAYLYGNLAADIINFKGYGGHYNHCHRWTIVDEFLEEDDGPLTEAFALGYLSHLAADTIAHNHFVPYHLVRFARTRGLGHLYWEMSADRFVDERRWDLVRDLKADNSLDALDDLVNRSVPKKALSMKTNKLLFSHVLLVSEREAWRKGMSRIHPMGRVALQKGFLERFRKAATARARLALSRGGVAKLEHIDTNGKLAQKEAIKLRKGLVRRYPSGPARLAAGEALAAPFLEGMQSPPRKNGNLAHWA
ncbi:MAG: zinc dependent phospholipase C family protein [Planctomycetes bacterium]|nr:zinc dependent phospholipase C family protein [Planctomycetota bacterium]